jgi:hypothetical protein
MVLISGHVDQAKRERPALLARLKHFLGCDWGVQWVKTPTVQFRGNIVIWIVIFKYKLYTVNLKLEIIERDLPLLFSRRFKHSWPNRTSLTNIVCFSIFIYLHSFELELLF